MVAACHALLQSATVVASHANGTLATFDDPVLIAGVLNRWHCQNCQCAGVVARVSEEREMQVRGKITIPGAWRGELREGALSTTVSFASRNLSRPNPKIHGVLGLAKQTRVSDNRRAGSE